MAPCPAAQLRSSDGWCDPGRSCWACSSLVVALAARSPSRFLQGARPRRGRRRTDLEAAPTALAAGDVGRGRGQVDERSRATPTSSQDSVQGIGGRRVEPRARRWGPGRATYATSATPSTTLVAVAEIGVEVLARRCSGEDATLFDGRRSVDITTLQSVITPVSSVSSTELDAAQRRARRGRPTTAGRRRPGSARRATRPRRCRSPRSATGSRRVDPLLDELPALLGAEGERSYLVALLNPAEHALLRRRAPDLRDR